MTVTIKNRRTNFIMTVADKVLPASYPSGGVTINPPEVGMEIIDLLLAASAGGYVFEYDHATKKLKVFQTTNVVLAGEAGAQGADNTVIKVSQTELGISGIGEAATVKNTAVEVASGTNLSSVTARLIALGY